MRRNATLGTIVNDRGQADNANLQESWKERPAQVRYNVVTTMAAKTNAAEPSSNAVTFMLTISVSLAMRHLSPLLDSVEAKMTHGKRRSTLVRFFCHACTLAGVERSDIRLLCFQA